MAPQSQILIEVCVDSVASATAAVRGGAARIELCGSLIEGGITPSAGLIEATRAAVSVDLHIMIRPRGGDFCYETDEFETMCRDIKMAQQLGANGVVFGILDIYGNIDVARTRQLVKEARPLSVTFHRAFDMTADLFRAVDDVCASGVARVLTSGGEPTCLRGADKIRELAGNAGDRVIIMPGSGIKPENARSLVDSTGVKEIHVGLRSTVASPMRHRNLRISMGPLEGREYQRLVVLQEKVSRLRSALTSGENPK
jgi:copper homeostasis protein